jgi:hypothetical protein
VLWSILRDTRLRLALRMRPWGSRRPEAPSWQLRSSRSFPVSDAEAVSFGLPEDARTGSSRNSEKQYHAQPRPVKKLSILPSSDRPRPRRVPNAGRSDQPNPVASVRTSSPWRRASSGRMALLPPELNDGADFRFLKIISLEAESVEKLHRLLSR